MKIELETIEGKTQKVRKNKDRGRVGHKLNINHSSHRICGRKLIS